MRKLALLTIAVIALTLLPTPARSAPGDRYRLGYNQAWIDGAFGRDLTTAFDENAWRRVLRRTREGGGSVLRVWLLENKNLEGVTWDFHKPTGITPELDKNVRKLGELARQEKVLVYWTLLDGNWPAKWSKKTVEFERTYNILNDKYGQTDQFNAFVVAPILDAIRANKDVCYGLDLMNEVQGEVKNWGWSDGWTGARRWMRRTATFVHSYAPGIKVTASSGHHESDEDILDGRFDGLGLDFLDVHVYTDFPWIRNGSDLAKHAKKLGVPIVLGEFGQKTVVDNPTFQAWHVRSIVNDGARLGFAAALAWRLEDSQPNGKHFSFFDGNTPRPAHAEMKRLSLQYPQ